LDAQSWTLTVLRAPWHAAGREVREAAGAALLPCGPERAVRVAPLASQQPPARGRPLRRARLELIGLEV